LVLLKRKEPIFGTDERDFSLHGNFQCRLGKVGSEEEEQALFAHYIQQHGLIVEPSLQATRSSGGIHDPTRRRLRKQYECTGSKPCVK
jgi:hypothetical protein